MRTLASLLILGLVTFGASPDSPATQEPDLSLGIRQVEEGEFDQAVLTLDAAARRLQERGVSGETLARSHFYSGIAYLGLGMESSARDRFRKAWTENRTLSVTAREFAPNVVGLYGQVQQQAEAEEAAARRVAQAPAAARSTSASSEPPANKKSKKPVMLILAGGVAAAGGGLALAGGGGSSSPPTASNPSPTPTPTTAPTTAPT